MVIINPEDLPPAYNDDLQSLNVLSLIAKTGSVVGDSALDVLLTVTPPREAFPVDEKKSASGRSPVDICLVIDVSGSMGASAPVPGAKDSTEDSGLSVLDVVKHAVRTIVTTMQDNDRIAVVTFSSTAKVAAPLTHMTTEGKKKVVQIVEKFAPEDSTNLWEGLKRGMNLLCDDAAGATDNALVRLIKSSTTTSKTNYPSSKSRLSTIFLLTDGCPNVEPLRGHIPMLKSYLDSHKDNQFTISTFGFGYSLDSALLVDIAKLAGGGYGFIPDAGMVGTVFVHAGANFYATYGRCVVNVELEDKIDKVLGDLNCVQSSCGVRIDLGDVQYGQTKDVVIRLKPHAGDPPPTIQFTARYHPWNLDPSEPDLITHISHEAATPEVCDPDIKYHGYRSQFVSTVSAFVPEYNLVAKTNSGGPSTTTQAQDEFQALLKTIRHELPNHPDALALCEDIEGQVLIALSTLEHLVRWGRHYLPSLARSHQRQQCGNFKDPGLQVYGRYSPIFISSRDEMDAAFDSLPPPTPSYPVVHGRPGVRGKGRPRNKVSSMKQWNRSSAPCFSGHCLINLVAGETMKVENIMRGAHVMTPKGMRSVAAVLRTSIHGGATEMCEIGDLLVTPWHPIVHQGKWVFPAEIAEPRVISCDAVYSILLSPSSNPDAHGVWVGNTLCVTLGHGIVQDKQRVGGDVRAHAFLGDYVQVLASLSQLPGFFEADGVVHSAVVNRSPHSGLISGFWPPQNNVHVQNGASIHAPVAKTVEIVR